MINNNITEDYCSFEIAKLLKEKGFHCYCFQAYKTESNPITDSWWKIGELNKYMYCRNKDHNDAYYGLCSAPSHFLAIKWIRENFAIHIFWDFGLGYESFIIPLGYMGEGKFSASLPNFENPEKAVEAAILYTLQNLIP